ncbi:pyroglutamyl-peptidase I Cysteine peptidase. MEROPS family C15 [Neorhodopirellula lusitana]|uniref:Pyrrolidone-carboxylate peptidase n=1 Tax=Neorhodopirellula lusitana TaxID=445327 RepID=A0ABY1PWN9_9BACT|nr:pyroglutamyl-peptidase I [Neorhodopirellula lusitana]SMP50009.1 pyroglutamyl-peptidase I Cysteine peptidase. MEROPS family C15 [Neorhodopirellula lusitana]
MTRVLLTAFEPYDRWPDNASWLALMDLTHWYDGPVELVTRRYPVDLAKMSEKLRTDLQEDYDFALHCGQGPGSSILRLESIGLNLRTDGSEILSGAPAAYRSSMPLDAAAARIRGAGIPATVSHHAGTFLCNAALFLSQHYIAAFGMKTSSAFIHVPLSPGQVARENSDSPSMSTPMVSAAMAVLIQQLLERSSIA